MKGSHTYRIAVLPGDGTGPEVVGAARGVLDEAQDRFGFHLELEEHACGAQHYVRTGKEWADGALEATKEAHAILLGAIGWPGATLPSGDIAGSGVVFGLRFGLDLYANVRPTKLYPGVQHKVHDSFSQVWRPERVDLVIVRENTEGLYTPVRGQLERGGEVELAIDNNVITRKGSERVIRAAFELCKTRNGAPADRKHRVTCIDKANVLAGSRLFRATFDRVAANYPDVEREHAFVDAFTQWLVRSPENYDVCVTTNMLGDIVTDLAAVLQGGMGMAPAGNIGDRHAMFEPVHGSSPKHAGRNVVNPIACILASSMMLDWLGRRHKDRKLAEAATGIERAVEGVLAEGRTLSYDVGGRATTTDVAAAIAARLGTG